MISRRILPTLIYLLLGSICIAQSSTIVQEVKVYKRVNDKDLKVDVFYSDSSPTNDGKPAIAFFHGGGWVFGNPDEFYEACRRYAMKGFVTFSFQYRLSIREDGTYPHPAITPVESVKDARSAIRWIRENAEDLKVDPDKIIVSGQSAGGQLALCAELADSINEISDDLNISPKPNALVLYSSNVNTMEAWIDMLMGERKDEIWDISPYHLARKVMPPAIDFHGDDDCTVLPYIVDMFKRRMMQLENHFELITYPGRQHYLGEGNDKYARYFDEEILQITDGFLTRLGFMPTDH
ncbi:MAG: alpha/beta hydrolase [Saprospiraceae bacterium]|nr:alpha/beta hydrolase [Saprospiraceae bacterium]